MRRRKTIIGMAVAFALTLLIAGSAYAVTAGQPQGYRGGSEAAQSTAVGVQNASAQNPEITCPAGGDQERSCDQLRDGSCEECDGNGTRAGVAQGAGSTEAAGPTTQTRARTGECEGTCEQVQALTQTRTRERDGDCEQTPTQAQTQSQTQNQPQTQTQAQTQTQLQAAPGQCPQDGACVGEGPYGPEGESNGPGPNNDSGYGSGSCPMGSGNGLGNGAGR